MKLIDADKLRKDVLDLPDCDNGFSDTYDKARIIDLVDEQPIIDPVKYGYWIEIDKGLLWQCSECEHYSVSGGDYCEWCGTKMNEVKNEIN